MKIVKNRMFQSFFIQLFGLMLIEITFRLISGFSIFNYSLLRVLFFSGILSTIVAYITSFFKPKWMCITNIVLLFIYSFYAFVQIGYFNYMGVYMSISASSQLEAVTSYIPEFTASFKNIYYAEFIPFIGITLIIIVTSIVVKNKTRVFKLKKHFRYENTISLLTAMTLVLSFSILYYNYIDDKYMQAEQAVSLKDLFVHGQQPGIYIKEFGVLPFSVVDIKNKIYPKDYITLTDLVYEPTIENETRSFDDTAWREIIQTETNNILNSLNNYFINNTITSKNEMTGLFENKNVIVIMMESVNDIIDNEEYFPNYAYLKNNGWNFENHYSPRNNCPTGNNEFSSLTGLYSNPNECSANIHYSNTYFESLFNLFNNKGYYTNSYHNYYEKYYSRSLYHPNLGSQLYHDSDMMGLETSPYIYDWTSDEDMMEYYLETLDTEIPKGKKFMSYIITVSSHSTYKEPSTYGDMYLDMTEDTDYSMDMRRYLSKLKVVDNALGILIEGLKERKLLDDTVIVIYGDHYPYSLDNDILHEVLDRSLDDYEAERTPLVIYNPKIESETYQGYTSYINLTPTLANLFDLDFDPRLYTGEDYFSEEFSGIISFADLSWKNEHAYYNATTGEITYYDDVRYTPDEIKEINRKIYNKNSASVMAISYNYFSYLEAKLKTYKEEVDS